MDFLELLHSQLEHADPLRLTLLVNTISETYQAVTPYLAPAAPAMAFGITILLTYAAWKYNPVKYLIGARNSWRLYRAARTRGLQEMIQSKREQEQELGIVIITHIEAQVDNGKMTRRQANDHYASLAKKFPIFIQCIERDVDRDPKEAIKDRLAESQFLQPKLP